MGASIDSTDSRVPQTGQTFRTEGSVRVGAACGLLGAIVLVIYGATAHGASSHSTTVGRAVAFVGAGLMIVFSTRAFTLGVYVAKDRVRIRNLLITRWVRLADVEKFSFGQLRVFPAVGIATLSDGRKLAMTGIAVGRGARKRARVNAASVVAELNDLLKQHRADPMLGR